MHISATYSPEDNKIRLTASERLDAALYERVKAAGFSWAPKQGIFVAPKWTPSRADLAEELAGEIGDEDTTLVDRAAERAERFEDYSDKRERDAHAAKATVEAIASGIPFGQPILVGHHSEKRARKDADRIESGMRKAVKMWETSAYWEERAKGAIGHAKYKERPDVRHRRIKGIEADRRKVAKEVAESERLIVAWERETPITLERALKIANFDRTHFREEGGGSDSVWGAVERGKVTPEDAARRCVSHHRAMNAHRARWLAHYDLRLAYERAMLGESGGLVADKFDIQPGGRVLLGGAWYTVKKVNKAQGRINSATILGHNWRRVVPVEDVGGYEPPTDDAAAKVKAATRMGPLVNVKPANGERVETWTKAQWDRHNGDGCTCAHKYGGTTEHGPYRERQTMRGGTLVRVYVSDLKETPIPAPTATEATKAAREDLAPKSGGPRFTRESKAPKPEATAFAAMKDSLKAGVTVVSAPQLFPTPADLCAAMVDAADITPRDRVLEPSAGTGNIVRAILERTGVAEIMAVEINQSLASGLSRFSPRIAIKCADFLEWNTALRYDRIVMNPPFGNGADILHIQHAASLLAPGGRLVALCAAGPRQRKALERLGVWEDLPPGSFSEQGTNVSVAMLTIDAPEAPKGRDEAEAELFAAIEAMEAGDDSAEQRINAAQARLAA